MGSNEAVSNEMARRLASRGVATEVVRPESATTNAVPTLVVLAERRPLAPEVVAVLTRIAAGGGPAALVNLLTPEVDLPLRPHFPTRLQTADHTRATLDAVAATWTIG